MENNQKILLILKLFDEILDDNAGLAIKILNHFISKIRRKHFILKTLPKQDNLDITVFDFKWKNNFIIKKLESRIKSIVDNLQIQIDKKNSLSIIDEVVIMEINWIWELNPLCFFTMINDRKAKNEFERLNLARHIKNNFKHLEDSWRKMPITDWRIIVQKDNHNESFDIMIKKGDFVFGFNNFTYSLNELEKNFKINTDKIESEVRSINNVYIQ